MQNRESSIYNALTNIRLQSFGSLGDIQKSNNSDDCEELDSPVITLPLLIGLIICISLQYLIGYNMSICNGLYNYIYANNRTILEWSLGNI